MSMLNTVVIPDKTYFKIGEVAKLLDLEPYVLRYWESEFDSLDPQKTDSGQRIYQREDIELIIQIRGLLYDEMFTIAGARRQLELDEADPSEELAAEDGEQGSEPSAQMGLWEERLSSQSREITDLHEELADLKDALQAAKNELSQAKDTLAARKTQTSQPGPQLNALKAELADARAANQALNAELTQAQRELADSHQTQTQTRDQLRRAQRTIAELKADKALSPASNSGSASKPGSGSIDPTILQSLRHQVETLAILARQAN